MSFARQLLDDFDRDLERGARLMFDEFVRLAQADRATPRATGALADGIRREPVDVRPGRVTTLVQSTARAGSGADYGSILDQSTGRTVQADSYGHRAFGPISPPLSGGRQFVREFRVSTKHVGWWDEATRIDHLRTAARQLGKVDL